MHVVGLQFRAICLGCAVRPGAGEEANIRRVVAKKEVKITQKQEWATGRRLPARVHRIGSRARPSAVPQDAKPNPSLEKLV
jgi:hypothetical protein